MQSASGNLYPTIAPVDLRCATDFGMMLEIINGSSPGHIEHGDSDWGCFPDIFVAAGSFLRYGNFFIGIRSFIAYTGCLIIKGSFSDLRAGCATPIIRIAAMQTSPRRSAAILPKDKSINSSGTNKKALKADSAFPLFDSLFDSYDH